jgi:hypothetical protein
VTLVDGVPHASLTPLMTAMPWALVSGARFVSSVLLSFSVLFSQKLVACTNDDWHCLSYPPADLTLSPDRLGFEYHRSMHRLISAYARQRVSMRDGPACRVSLVLSPAGDAHLCITPNHGVARNRGRAYNNVLADPQVYTTAKLQESHPKLLGRFKQNIEINMRSLDVRARLKGRDPCHTTTRNQPTKVLQTSPSVADKSGLSRVQL